MPNTTRGAENIVTQLLSSEPQRLQHVRGVARNMEAWLDYLGVTGEEREIFMQIAWLHDIGYSPVINVDNFHAVDGYNYLVANGWSFQVCVGVLTHSFSYELAELSRVDLLKKYGTRKQVEVIEKMPEIFSYITLIDLHTSASGELISFEERRKDIHSRHGENSVTWHIYEITEPFHRLMYLHDFHKFLLEQGVK